MNVDRLRGLEQPDQRSCGPSSLVAARMLVDPAYAPASFAADVLDLHRLITGPRAFGRSQLPWPRALGTPPWAVARTMTEITGLPHASHVVRWGDRSATTVAMIAAVTEGHPCPLYVGNGWSPRHVVLVVGAVEDRLQIDNPARGSIADLPRAAFVAGDTSTVSRWLHPWFVVTPQPRARRTPA